MFRKLFPSSNAIDVHEAARRLEAGSLVLVDVREAAEWRDGHASGARHVPLSTVPKQAKGLSAHDRPVAFICLSGSRSSSACAVARSHGIEAINVRGGMSAWKRAGLPIARGR